MLGRILSMVSRQRRFVQGAFFASVFFLIASIVPCTLATLEHFQVMREGYESAGFMWLFFGLPVSLLEILFEKKGLFLADQLVNLFLLAWMNFVAVGATIGHFSAKTTKGEKPYS